MYKDLFNSQQAFLNIEVKHYLVQFGIYCIYIYFFDCGRRQYHRRPTDSLKQCIGQKGGVHVWEGTHCDRMGIFILLKAITMIGGRLVHKSLPKTKRCQFTLSFFYIPQDNISPSDHKFKKKQFLTQYNLGVHLRMNQWMKLFSLILFGF